MSSTIELKLPPADADLPADSSAYHIPQLALIKGEYEQAAEAYRAALGLDADFALSRANLALSLIALNRFDEAQESSRRGWRAT